MVGKVNEAREAKVAYYDKRQAYDAALSKLRDCAKKLEGLDDPVGWICALRIRSVLVMPSRQAPAGYENLTAPLFALSR